MKKNKVVLIYPRLSLQSSTFLQSPFALLTIAPYLQKAGYEVQIIDARTSDNYKGWIKASLTDNTLFVGVTAMTGSQVTGSIEIAKFVKSVSRIPVVWGGIHASLMPDQTIEPEYVDYVLVGEAENNVVEFADALSAGAQMDSVSGIYYKINGEIRSTPQKPLFNLQGSLVPAWDLVDVTKYNNIGLQTARGCPFPCTYCYNVVFNQQKWRTKPLELVQEEVLLLVNRFGVKSLFLYDDNFFTQKQRVEDFSRWLIKSQLGVTWYTTCRADYFPRYGKEFFKVVKESGCETVACGLESGSQRILDIVQKKETVEHYYEMAHITAEVGIVPECGFMIGIPGETDADRRKTFQFMDDLVRINPKAYATSLAIYTPYPGAPLIETIKKDYGFRPDKLEDWGNYNFHNCNLAWLSKKEQNRLEVMSYVPRFVFWKEKLKQRYINKPLLPAYYIMTFLAALRWKYRFFGLPLEYFFLKKFMKYRQSGLFSKLSRVKMPPNQPKNGEAWVCG